MRETQCEYPTTTTANLRTCQPAAAAAGPQATKDTPSGAGGSAEPKITDWVLPTDKSGEFKRQQSTFRHWISREKGARFPPEKGRYHLYVSYACPWVSIYLPP